MEYHTTAAGNKIMFTDLTQKHIRNILHIILRIRRGEYIQEAKHEPMLNNVRKYIELYDGTLTDKIIEELVTPTKSVEEEYEHWK